MTRPSGTRPSGGFTLLEVIAALAALGLVLTMLSGGARIGLRGVATYHRAILPLSEIEPAERALRRMIERMDPGLYPEPPSVRGSAHSLAFTTELPDPASGGTLTADVRLLMEDDRLVLSWTPHSRGIPFAAPPLPRRTVLLEGVATLDLSYAPKGRDAAWQPAWSQPAIPALVRVRLVMNGDARHPWPAIIVRPPREQAEE